MKAQNIFMTVLGIGVVGFGIWYFMGSRKELATPPTTNEYDLPTAIPYPTRTVEGVITDPASIGALGVSVQDLGGGDFIRDMVAQALAPFSITTAQPVVRQAGVPSSPYYASGGGAGRNVSLVVEQPTLDEKQTESFANLVKRYGSEAVAMQQRQMFRTSLAPTNIASSRTAPVQTAGTLQVRSSTPVANLEKYSQPQKYVGLR